MKKRDQTKTLLVEQLRKGPIVESACQKVGISRMTFYRWKSEDEKFSKEVDQAILDGQKLINDLAESQLISAVNDKNIPAITYWLKHHHPSYKTRIEIEGAIETIQKLSPEDEALRIKAFKLLGITITEHGQQPTEQ